MWFKRHLDIPLVGITPENAKHSSEECQVIYRKFLAPIRDSNRWLGGRRLNVLLVIVNLIPLFKHRFSILHD